MYSVFCTWKLIYMEIHIKMVELCKHLNAEMTQAEVMLEFWLPPPVYFHMPMSSISTSSLFFLVTFLELPIIWNLFSLVSEM